jgi:uncharacterized protein (DUF58 family)
MADAVPFAPVLEAVRGLGWPARRRARAAIPGPHVAATQRASAELSEYRPYRQGDDPGRIDWKLVARTDRVYVRLSPDRSLLPTLVVLDASASMAYPAESLDKWRLATQLALGLAAIARAGGDPVGLLVVREQGSVWVAPRTRRSVLDEMIRAMVPPPTGAADLTPALAPLLRRASRIAIVSDLLGDAEPLLGLVRQFVARGGDAFALHVVHRLEIDPDRRTLLCADPEQEALRRPLSTATRQGYVHAFAKWRADLASQWRGAGVHFVESVPDQTSLRQLVRTAVDVPAAR